MRKSIVLTLFIITAAGVVLAQPQSKIQHSAPSCLRPEQNGILVASVASEGTPRAYFRRAEATEWCYVDGERIGKNARFILPKFEQGTELEYFFVTIREGQVTARSADIHRVGFRTGCDALAARHIEIIQTFCPSGGGDVGSAMAAGYSVAPDDRDPISPEAPQQQ